MGRSRELAELGSAYDSGNSLGFRNRIINGDMRIDQRNAGASITPASTGATYTVDRWYFYCATASKFTIQQNAGSVTPPAGFKNYLGLTVASAYSITSADRFLISQGIEGFNTADLAWGTTNAQTVTLSFWVRSSLTGTFGGVLSGALSYPFTYTINAANTWEQKTITVTGPTTGSWATDNTGSVYLQFGLGVGASYTGPAGAWSATSYNSATGGVSVVGTAGATFYITGVQLEAGSVATPFERRDYGRELMMCQRYYQRFGAGLTFGMIGVGSAATTTAAQIVVPLSVDMRTTPTVSGSNLQVTDHQTSFAVSAVSVLSNQTNNRVGLVEATTTGLTQYRPYQMRVNGNAAGYLDYSAEL